MRGSGAQSKHGHEYDENPPQLQGSVDRFCHEKKQLPGLKTSSTYRCTCIPVPGYPCHRGCSAAPSSLASPLSTPIQITKSVSRVRRRPELGPALSPAGEEAKEDGARLTSTNPSTGNGPPVSRYPGFQASMLTLSNDDALVLRPPARAPHSPRQVHGTRDTHRNGDIGPQSPTQSPLVHLSPCIQVSRLPYLEPGKWPSFASLLDQQNPANTAAARHPWTLLPVSLSTRTHVALSSRASQTPLLTGIPASLPPWGYPHRDTIASCITQPDALTWFPLSRLPGSRGYLFPCVHGSLVEARHLRVYPCLPASRCTCFSVSPSLDSL